MKFTMTISRKLHAGLFSILVLLLFMGATDFYHIRDIKKATSELLKIQKKVGAYDLVEYEMLRTFETNKYLFEGYWGMYAFYQEAVGISDRNIRELELLIATNIERVHHSRKSSI